MKAVIDIGSLTDLVLTVYHMKICQSKVYNGTLFCMEAALAGTIHMYGILGHDQGSYCN